ncbi:MAG: magnesium/cobalt transporter CorA [Sulfurifustis sp.]
MLVNCVAYQEGRAIAEIDPCEISAYVNRPECFVWVALRDATDAELAQMQHEFALPDLAVEDARHGHQRPKIEEYGNSLFVVLRTVEMNGAEVHTGEMHIFVGRNYVLSVRNRTERGFQDVRKRTEREPELLRHGAGYVLYALMDAAVDRYFPILDALETELESIEQKIFADQSPRGNIEALYNLKQKLMTLKHAVGPLLEAVGRLFGGRVPGVCAGMGDYFRDIYDHLIRLNQTIDASREMLTTAISVNLSLITLQEGEVTKRLAAYGALVAVPTMIGGIYGMNFQHMPELHWQFGYPFALLVMFGIDAFLFWRFRRAGWL